MKILFAIALSFVSVAAQADFTGEWNGTGKVSNNQGLNVACEHVIIDITQTEKTMDVDSKFHCAGKEYQGPAGVLEVRGTDVYSNGAKIGTVSKDAVMISVVNANGSFTSETKMTGENKISFKSVRTDKAGMSMTYEGNAAR